MQFFVDKHGADTVETIAIIAIMLATAIAGLMSVYQSVGAKLSAIAHNL